MTLAHFVLDPLCAIVLDKRILRDQEELELVVTDDEAVTELWV